MDLFKKQITKEEPLKSGWKKKYYIKETSGFGRLCGAFLSLGVTELFENHSNVYRTEICDDAEYILGSTLLEAIHNAQKLADNYFKNEHFQKVMECLTAAIDNCPDGLTNEKITLRKSINMATSEIHYNKGLESAANGNFSAAIKSFQTAIDLDIDDSRRQVFLKAQKNAEAEILFKKSFTGNPNEMDHLERAKEYLDQALQLASDDYFNRVNFESSRNNIIAVIEETKNKAIAAELFKESLTLWFGACADEKCEMFEAAKRKFDEARAKLQEVLGIVSDNPDYQKWATICDNKIQGNSLYNRSGDLVREGNAAFTQRDYGNATAIYNCAYDLCLRAEKKFEEIQCIYACEQSQMWLDCVKELKESLSQIIESTTLFVPGEQMHNEHNRINEILHENIRWFPMRHAG